MKVRELIEMLKKQDQEIEVMIQQGEEYDYAPASSVEEMKLFDMSENSETDEPKHYLTINYY